MLDFKTRSYEKELMDDLSLDSDALRKNLIELRWINNLLGGNATLIAGLNHLKKNGFFKKDKLYQVADIGSGGGDNLVVMARWFKKHNIKAHLTGIDANGFMIQFATDYCKEFKNISFLQENILDKPITYYSFDITTCSLFCHHFTDTELVTIFKKIKKITKNYFIINDLHRHKIAYFGIYILTRLFNGSHLVKNDAPLSVRRGFKKKELYQIINKCWDSFDIRWIWAFRWLVVAKSS